MDTAQWPQGIEILKPSVENSTTAGSPTVEKKPRPQKEQALNCPRCNSTNTKFCYYNNYSLSQPRYFCKTCRRYWTEGGSLRNVPVGGGSRKNKRSSSTSSSATTSDINKKLISPHNFSPQNPKIQQGQDLNLAYNPYNGISEFNVTLPFGTNNSSSGNNSSHPIPVMELIKSSGNMSSTFMSSEMNFNSSGLNFIPMHHDFKPTLGFSLDGLENGYGNMQGVDQDHQQQQHHDSTNSSRSNFLFPFEELNKPVSSTNDHQFEQQQQQDRGGQGEANGYWNGMLTGGSW